MIKFTVKGIKEVTAGLNELKVRLADSAKSGLWNKISRFFKNIVQRMFGGGSMYGMEQWPRISPTLYGHIRYSSNGNAVGRYSGTSKPMVASGSYFKSFGQLSADAKRMSYGSSHPIASLIAKAGWNRKSGYRARKLLPDNNMPLFLQDITRVAEGHIQTIIREVIK
jgi:hypothetical protein